MFCPSCGNKVEDDALFCPYCGTKLADVTQQGNDQPEGNNFRQTDTSYDSENGNYTGSDGADTESGADIAGTDGTNTGSDGSHTDLYGSDDTATGAQNPGADSQMKNKKRKLPVRTIAIAAAVVVVLIIAMKLVSGLFGGSGYTVSYFYDSENGTTAFFVGTKEIGTADGSVYSTYSNIDLTAHFVLMTEDDSSYTAYYIAKSSVNKIAEDCSAMSVAANAKAALILDDEGTLYLYKCSGKKSTEVADDENIVSFVISGDGKTYAYTLFDYDEDTDDYSYDSYIGKKATKASGVIIVAMSETGKYIYGAAYDDDYDTDLVLVSSKGETTKISSDVDDLVALNEDGTQIMFLSDDKLYVSVKGGKKVKVASGSSVIVFVDYTEGTVCNYVYPVDSFKNAVISIYSGSDYTVYRLDDSYEAEEIADDIYSFYYGATLKYMYYTDDDDTLYRIELKAGKKAEEIADDVYSIICVSDDGTVCYYWDNDDAVHYVKNTSDKEVSALDDVDYIYGRMNGSVLYASVTLDGEDYLYYVNGKSAKEISDNEDIGVKAATFCDTIYAYDTEEDIIYEVSGKSLKKLSTSLENLTSGGSFF